MRNDEDSCRYGGVELEVELSAARKCDFELFQVACFVTLILAVGETCLRGPQCQLAHQSEHCSSQRY